MQPVLFTDLGQMDYKQAWDYQEQLLHKNVEAKTLARSLEAETGNQRSESGNWNADLLTHPARGGTKLNTQHNLLFVEHPPVYTLGKSGKPENVLISETERIAKGVDFYYTNRGGDITFHGPQQIVGYPILDLEKFYTDIGRYLRNLEEVIILTMAEYGLAGARSAGETGVWLQPGISGKERKICAIGVRCSRWITMHGFAFNVNTDLSYFDYIIPCGIQNKQVTSLQKELGRPLVLQEVKEKLKVNFESVFEVELVY